MSREAVRYIALFVPILAGLCASMLLLVDYVWPAPIFCGLESGCDVVRQTAFAWFGPVPTPAFGVAAFMLLGVLAWLRGGVARSVMLGVTSVGAALAAFLVREQARIGAFCKYCLVADSMLVLLLLLATWRFRGRWDLARGRVAPKLVAGGLALAVTVPLALGVSLEPDVPAVIKAEMAATPAGKVTVVDFVDFECPFCRMTHHEVAPVFAARKDRLHLVRRQVPLTSIHRQAMDAARAACCAEQLGKGDAMAEALFSSEDLSPRSCEKLAQGVDVDVDAYRKCVGDPATDERIQKDKDAFKAAHGHGLPTIWINGQRFEGAQPAEIYEKALDRAAGRRS
jgi:protein-disulfide isomerase